MCGGRGRWGGPDRSPGVRSRQQLPLEEVEVWCLRERIHQVTAGSRRSQRRHRSARWGGPQGELFKGVSELELLVDV